MDLTDTYKIILPKHQRIYIPATHGNFYSRLHPGTNCNEFKDNEMIY